ncbi:MAG: FkbM family methyltransferase [Pseudomonadota bacterium]|nr:FkbM family methyltransferase [Pseudomonadota bacterium]
MKRFLRKSLVWVGRILAALGVRLPERIFRHLHFVGPFDVALPNGTQIKLFSWGNRVENELAWRGWNGHEPVERERWLQMVSRPGDVLDVGANTGTFSFTAKAMKPDAKVVAFEPLNRIADKIRKNVEVSGLPVEIVGAAVSSQVGELPIYDPGGANAYSASLEADFLPGEKDSYLVPVVTVDAYCAEHNLRPTAMKIDVEGSEAKALLGAKHILAARECLVLCEWLGNSSEHKLATDLIDELGLVAVDLVTLEPVDTMEAVTFGERNILIGPIELIRELGPLNV